ncbi:MAG: hypothetical protein GWO19_18765 [Nitrospinaceae bacterium]|nr:hypothetical protein [Nitrospinaceae bacterium]NIR56346.1 hypothetical protein [Nitrospinaceae bacterium]NIS86806.1 hypothetical protein [Nitrospinaceae bacterium]NIT83640.1 hypothetical protein [Nitrospinaceae bacterium]NIU45843.1 hypothetical protein [Nitrospinaceae bacterium]
MSVTLKNLSIILFALTLGCTLKAEKAPAEDPQAAFKSMHPEERHYWFPPTREELEQRRRRQKELDEVAAELEQLFMRYAQLVADEIILENLISKTDPQLKQMEAKLDQIEAEQKKREQAVGEELKRLESSVSDVKADLGAYRKEQEARLFRPGDYRKAILLFRNRQYSQSIAQFNRVLKTHYPAPLKDNILFGLASNYFKLKQYGRSLRHLKTILQKHRRGDKWLVSHAMTGLIYTIRGQPDQAVKILGTALRHKPDAELRRILNRLMRLAREGVAGASS